ncbi:MAG TPA: deoxyribodipyrimidine photo-lyase [Opitutus sp.]|nr:deoxyribodipyrimidine photo-lyase [Opitutus sp.]
MTDPTAPTLLWFRQDLRLQDNPALAAALARGAPIVPVFILDETGDGRWPTGAAARWWLHHSLAALDETLRALGSRLLFARGESGKILEELGATTGAGALYWNRRYEPAAIERDSEVERRFIKVGWDVRSFNAALLHEPPTISNRQDRPFRVFTPYWRHCLTLPVDAPQRFSARTLPAPTTWPYSLLLDELGLLPRTGWDEKFLKTWQPGEKEAARRLARFTSRAIDDYAEERDFPNYDGTSTLSPSLHFGEISPRQVWAAVKAKSKTSGVFPASNGARVFLSEIGWREFAYHLLFHFPTTPERPFRDEFNRFPWADDLDRSKLRVWQRGRTGYPIVDAGMRQLWATGWMHNRVRMIVGSFLVKHLRLPWTEGASWFWDTLVDADLANNTLGWQWIAGCGADASPYFRVFSPVLQSRKFDPEGGYVRRWVPELAHLSADQIHAPWEAPAAVLTAAGVRLGETYPRPIVDHAEARDAALAAFKSLRLLRTDAFAGGKSA